MMLLRVYGESMERRNCISLPPGGRRHGAAMTEGERGKAAKFGDISAKKIQAFCARRLPQSASLTAPSRREP